MKLDMKLAIRCHIFTLALVGSKVCRAVAQLRSVRLGAELVPRGRREGDCPAAKSAAGFIHT